ncbi:hypothetical protein [Aquabacter sp. CN5-332]|uniref:hypothetical protein n=1 Tax=Aquabacter sp. CN5-332 TaxID=3156608 RepID=UPI0032B426E1
MSPRSADGEGSIAIGLVLERKVDPSNFLNLNWGDRQKEIARLEGKNELWTMFGANGDEFHKIRSDLEADGINILNTGGFVSTPESRTIWIDVNAEQFTRIFGTDLLVLGNDSDGDKMFFWQGTLSTKPDWNIAGEQRSAITGLWLDSGEMPIIQNLHSGTPVDPPQGPQSIGNLDTGASAL